jgi:hypothetical protein
VLGMLNADRSVTCFQTHGVAVGLLLLFGSFLAAHAVHLSAIAGGRARGDLPARFSITFPFWLLLILTFFRVVTKKHSARARPVKSQNTLSHTERLFFISLSRKPLPTTQPRTPPNYSFPQFSGTYFLTQLPTHLAAERSQIN